MRKGNLTLFLVCFFLAAGGCRCGSNIAGGSSDTEVSASITGTINDSAGNCIPYATIRLRPTDYLPGGGGVVPANESDGIVVYDGSATKEGTFTIDSVVKGEYVLEINSGDSTGMILPVFVDSMVTVSAVLEPFGTVAGDIDMYQHPGMYGKTIVQLYGTEYLAHPDTYGHFMMNIPYGPYSMRLSGDTTLVDEMVVKFTMKPSQLYHVGTLRMMTLNMPCFEYACDSLTVRGFLDAAGQQDVTVDEVSSSKFGRIYKLDFRGISLTGSLSQLGQLSALKEIDLGKTGITDSCRFVMNLWELEVLLLDSNNITGLSQGFGTLSRLLRLDVSYNYIDNLPEQIVFTRPWSLNLNGNALCSLSEDVTEWADRFGPGWHDEQICSEVLENGGAGEGEAVVNPGG